MSQSSHSDRNGQFDAENVMLVDADGRSLSCFIERSFFFEGDTYFLLQPVDSPIAIIAWDSEEETAGATWIEDSEELETLFADAKAVLAEQNLTLNNAAYTFTVAGELPPYDEDDLLAIEIEQEDGKLETDEFQFLAHFYHQSQEYEIYTPLTPLLFFAKETASGDLELLSTEELAKIQPFLEDFL